ncbi:MAG TPA: hypothetical protein VGE40_03390 [Bacilli bacterium]
MAESSPMRIDNQTKLDLESYKDKKRLKTHSDAVEELLRYHHVNELNKQKAFEEKEAEKARKAAEDIYVGAELKISFNNLANDLGLRSHTALIHFLMEHYGNSETIHKSTFEVFKDLRSKN